MHPLTHTGLGHRLTAKRPQTHPRVLEPVIGEWPLLSQRWGNVGCPGLHQPMIKALSNPCFFWEMILKNNPQCSNCIKLPLLKVTTSWYNDTGQGICFCFGGLFFYLFYRFCFLWRSSMGDNTWGDDQIPLCFNKTGLYDDSMSLLINVKWKILAPTQVHVSG